MMAVDTNTKIIAMPVVVVVVVVALAVAVAVAAAAVVVAAAVASSVPCTMWMFYGDIKSYQVAIYISAEWFWNNYLCPYNREREQVSHFCSRLTWLVTREDLIIIFPPL
jgi:hypothetical protein